MKIAIRLIITLAVLGFGYDYYKLRSELADYQDVREQALCAHFEVISHLGGHSNDGEK